MLTAIAVPYSTLPLEFIEAFGLEPRVHERGGERELQFRQGSARALLPVWHEGRFLLARWGCKRGESRVLPACGWTKLVTVASGWWAAVGAEEVEIPASLGLDGGIWFAIREGIRGLLVRDERDVPRVYVLCEPASHYYRIMTKSQWMPVLIGERI
jgi:hypothetical protein